jgi:WD40 repeat protein
MNNLYPRLLKVTFLRVLAVATGVVLLHSTAFAQLSVQVVSTNASALPLVSAQIKALKAGNPITLTDKNLFIIEDNRYSPAASISAPDANGVQTVGWYTQLRGSSGVKLLVSDGAEIAETSLTIGTLPFFAFFQSAAQERRISEYKFGTVAPGSTGTLNIRIKIQGDTNLYIDSITTGTRFFKAEWMGGWGVPQKLPGKLVSGVPASVTVTFHPEDNSYYQDVVSVYYEGGAVDRLTVYGNKIELEEITVLQLLSPNGSEILAPCTEFPIRWTGNVKEFPTIIEYTKDNGATWKLIEEVNDTTYLWKVPDEISDSVRIRVRQEFQRSAEGSLNGEKSAAQALGFSADGTLFVSAHANGLITEWNAQSFAKVRTLNLQPSGNDVKVTGAGYGATSTSLAAAYTQLVGEDRAAMLALFKNGANTPTSEIPLPPTFRLKKMIADPQGRFFAMIPDLGREILLYDDAGTLFKTLSFNAPITSANINSDGSRAIIILLTGTVEFYELPSFLKRPETLDISRLPIIRQAAVSPDASLLAVATQQPTGTSVSRESEVFIIDIATGNIIRHLVSPTSALFSEAKSLAFNATGRSLVLGYASNPKVSLWSFAKEDGDYSDLSLNLAGELSDVSFGPDGRFAIASGLSSQNGNLVYRRFTYPETDMSNGFFRIVSPLAELKTPAFENTYLGAQNVTTTALLCNTGEAPIILETATFKYGSHFAFASPFLKDTILPGECLNVSLVFMPRDTGMIPDTLTLATCSRNLKIALNAFSIPRNIGLTADNTNFGELCVGSSTERDLAFLKNNDPVPLKINSLTVFDQFSSAFTILTPVKDTILQPGESLAVRIQFKPKKLGEDKRKITINYADQKTITTEITLIGIGTGADLQAVSAFPFIPEILNRKLVLKNNSPNTVSVTQVSFEPEGVFSILTSLPITIPANSEGEIEIAWPGLPPTDDVHLKIQTTPCGTEKTIILRQFKGVSTISAPTVEADVHATDVQIPITFKNNENTAYGGTRFFEAEVLINPRLFLAESVTSDLGPATFTQEIIDGKRVIKVRVEGDFKGEGVAAVIHGIAGIAETLESPIEFNQSSKFFGSAVTVTSQPGLLKITGAGSRRVIQPNLVAQIMAVFPNPARENVTLEIDAIENSAATFEIYNMLGEKLSESSTQLLKGISTSQLNVAVLPAGTYRIVLKTGGAIVSTSLLNVAR